MAQKHEGNLSIDRFLGLNQSADNIGLSYAAKGYNFSVEHGVLQSVNKASEQKPLSSFEPDHTFITDEYGGIDARNDIRMLGFISQRWKDGYSGAIPADTTWLITVLNGRIYARKSVGGTTTGFHGTDWIEVYNGAFVSDLFDCVTYEINYAPPEIFNTELLIKVMNKTINLYAFDTDDYAYHVLQGGDGYAYYINNDGEEKQITLDETYVRRGYDYPVDALVMSNSKDGMYLVYCKPAGAGNETTLSVSPIRIQPSGETHEMKFGCIARYSERIWGAGIETDPDKLVYSAPYDIFNWEQNNNEPEDGAGDIQQPDWDGDGFTALKAFGNQLVCFKKNSIWAITGTNPSAFYMRKQYGHGTIYEDSIAVHDGNIFFVTDTGIHSYDSINVSPVRYGYLNEAFEAFSKSVKKSCVSCMCSGKYYFNLVTYDSGFNIESFYCYDTLEGTISAYRNVVWPLALSSYNDSVYALCVKDSKWRIVTLSGYEADELYYLTGWHDFGAKNVLKNEFEVYLMANVEMGDTVEMEVGIETEYKEKAKTVTLISGKVKRIKLNAKGRKFRFWLKSKPQQERWKLMGGIQLMYGLDYD